MTPAELSTVLLPGGVRNLSTSDRLARLGYTHHRSDVGMYKHAIYDPSGVLVGHMSAHEASEFLESIGG